ncbi:MAG: hypothetical protein ACYTDW_05725 [Planctomycetota bacterium]
MGKTDRFGGPKWHEQNPPTRTEPSVMSADPQTGRSSQFPTRRRHLRTTPLNMTCD